MNVFCLETGQIAPELSVFKYLIRQRSFVDRNNMLCLHACDGKNKQ